MDGETIVFRQNLRIQKSSKGREEPTAFGNRSQEVARPGLEMAALVRVFSAGAAGAGWTITD